MSKLNSSLFFTLAIGSAVIAIYFWVEASELQSMITLAQDARDVVEKNNTQLQKEILCLRRARSQPGSSSPRRRSDEAEGRLRDTKKLHEIMKRLSDREKIACRDVSHLANELVTIRREIDEAYKERDKYKHKLNRLRYSPNN